MLRRRSEKQHHFQPTAFAERKGSHDFQVSLESGPRNTVQIFPIAPAQYQVTKSAEGRGKFTSERFTNKFSHNFRPIKLKMTAVVKQFRRFERQHESQSNPPNSEEYDAMKTDQSEETSPQNENAGRNIRTRARGTRETGKQNSKGKILHVLGARGRQLTGKQNSKGKILRRNSPHSPWLANTRADPLSGRNARFQRHELDNRTAQNKRAKREQLLSRRKEHAGGSHLDDLGLNGRKAKSPQKVEALAGDCADNGNSCL